MTPTLTQAIEKAVEVHDAEVTATEPVVEPTAEPTEPVEPTKEPADVDQDAVQGKQLVQALRNPESAAFIIDYLAKQAGYTKADVAKIETKQDVKDTSKDILATLEESLGEEFKFLAPKLAPAIQKAVEGIRVDNSETESLRERLNRTELREIQKETQEAHVGLSQEYFGADDMPANVTTALSKAMDEFPPTDPEMSPTYYYKRIFSLVAGELGLTKKTTTSRVASAKADVPAKLRTSQPQGAIPSDATPGLAKRLSIDDAVKLAMEQVNKK